MQTQEAEKADHGRCVFHSEVAKVEPQPGTPAGRGPPSARSSSSTEHGVGVEKRDLTDTTFDKVELD